MSRSLHLAVAALAGLLLLAACGDDSDTAAAPTTAAAPAAADTTAGGDTDAAADTDPYCALVAEINSAGFPTADQVRKYQELAPDEIQDQVAIAGPAIIEADEAGNGEAAMSDPAVASAVEKITAFEGETCGPASQGGDAAATGDVDPEFADWCAATSAVNAAPVPTEELLAAAEKAAPDEISDDVAVVAAAFRDGIAKGDPGLGYVRESYEHIIVIDSFDAEHCGIPQDPGDFQDPAITTPDPNAAQVGVTATEFGFAFDPPAAGHTTFTMTNKGKLAHVMMIVQAAPGLSGEEALEKFDSGGVAAVYGSYVAVPGEDEVLTVDLVAGGYAMVCYLPTSDGAPHYTLGMMTPFNVS